MSVQTPAKWETAAIGEVADIVAGGTPPSKDVTCFALPGSAIAWLTPADLSGYKKQFIKYGSRDLTEKGLASCSAKLMPAGAVLFSSRAPIGYVAIAEGPISTNQGFKSFVFPDQINNRFSYYQLRHLVPEAEARATGTTFKELSGSAAAKLPFLVAPEAEQRRIADKLDTILTRVDALNDRLAHITPLLKRFRQSVLAAATSGRLTEDWRSTTGKTSMWTATKFGAVMLDLRYGTSKKCEVESKGTAVLRIPNVGDAGTPDLTELKFAEFEDAELTKLALRQGDILVIRSNGSVDLVGKACVVDERSEGLLFAGYLMRMRLDIGKTIPKFAYYVLSSPALRTQIELTAKSTSGVNNINSEELRSLSLALPSVEEQTEIVRRVEILFAYADRLEARLQTARTAADRLTPALLAKAFRGELVPQDPNDEPAAELLRRLREARAAQAPAKKTRGRKLSAA